MACALAACGNPQTGGGAPEPVSDKDKPIPTTTIVVDTNDVGRFRGTTMVELLKKMDSDDSAEWHFVRRHVFPPPQEPSATLADGSVVENFAWPAEDAANPSAKQKAWRSFLLWPAHIRELLLVETWSDAANRKRLAQYGRMYELTWKFQTAPDRRSERDESEHWRAYAESMLTFGKDGESQLVSNMIMALTSPIESMTKNAQSVLVQVGKGAIEPLCAAMWVGHRQRSVLDDGTFHVQGNPNFNRYLAETLYRIGSTALPQVVFELENSLDADGKATGSSWRFRRYFVELLGRFGHSDTIRTLEAEIDRVVVIEYEPEALARGREVIDAEATDTGRFVFHEYLIQAFSGIPSNQCLRGIIKLWALDREHENSAIDAIRRITGKRMRSIEEAKRLAKTLDVKLDAE